MITIVDYGTGNLASIANMLKKIGHGSVITANAEKIARAEKLILPGVGAFDVGMGNLLKLNLSELLSRKALVEKTPILGVCLGAQLFMKGSEEGKLAGLGWIEGQVVLFSETTAGRPPRVPHMSWNFIEQRKKSRLFDGMNDEARFYFVHSYHFTLCRAEDVLARTVYGYSFVSAFERENIVGVQFHPEKSHKFGMQVLQNFAEMY
jgi:glutamine amidotransferase